MKKHIKTFLESFGEWEARLLRSRWFRATLPFQLGAFLIWLGLTAWHSYVETHGFGPPVVFAAKAENEYYVDENGQQIPDGFHVMLVTHDQPGRVTSRGLMVLKNTHGALIRAYPFHERTPAKLNTPVDIDIRLIVKMEFKVPDSSLKRNLWTIRHFNETSLSEIVQGYAINQDEFRFYRRVNDSTYQSFSLDRIADIFFRENVGLNGIEVVGDTLWLMGYDGDFYRLPLRDETALRANGPVNAKPKPVNLRRVYEMRHNRSLSFYWNWGWQGIDAFQSGSRNLFAAVNSKQRRLIVLQQTGLNGNIDLMVVDSVTLSTPRQSKWHEGPIVHRFPEFVTDSLYVITTDAYAGEVQVDKTDKIANLQYLTQSSAIWQDTVHTPEGKPAYLEGVALGNNEHATLFISDRKGTIYYIPCFHTVINKNSATLGCRLRQMTPGRIWHLLFGKGFYYDSFQMPNISHGQELSVDDAGGLWFAEDNYFRYVHPEVFATPYQWAINFWVKLLLLLPIALSLFLRLDNARTAQLKAKTLQLENDLKEREKLLTENKELSHHLSEEKLALQNALTEQERLQELLTKRFVISEEEQDPTSQFPNLISRSGVMKKVKRLIEKFAPLSHPVLILGETGCGKELIAKAIILRSGRPLDRYATINCATLKSELLDSELFGHVKGSFTGANSDKKGLFEDLNDGTVFLDEIGEIPMSLQAKLLRLLENHEFQRVGDRSKTLKTNARIIAATNINLQDKISTGEFRRDLYHRLNSFEIFVPPLRERKEDIPLLVKYFYEKYRSDQQKETGMELSEYVVDKLKNYSWPGNVRQLQNVIIEMTTLNTEGPLKLSESFLRKFHQDDHKANTTITSTIGDFKNKGSLDDLETLRTYYLELDQQYAIAEKEVIEKALKLLNGNVKKAAKHLRIKQSTLYLKIKALSINPKAFK